MSEQDPKVPQLSDHDLSKVVGGEISLPFNKIEFSYSDQKSDGTAPTAPAKPPVKK
jgi:hypothetical protein